MAGEQLMFCAVPPGEREKDDIRDASACETSGSDSDAVLCLAGGVTVIDERGLVWFLRIASSGVSGSGSGVVVAPVKISTVVVVTDVAGRLWPFAGLSGTSVMAEPKLFARAR